MCLYSFGASQGKQRAMPTTTRRRDREVRQRSEVISEVMMKADVRKGPL